MKAAFFSHPGSDINSENELSDISTQRSKFQRRVENGHDQDDPYTVKEIEQRVKQERAVLLKILLSVLMSSLVHRTKRS